MYNLVLRSVRGQTAHGELFVDYIILLISFRRKQRLAKKKTPEKREIFNIAERWVFKLKAGSVSKLL